MTVSPSSPQGQDLLRSMIREVLRDVLPGIVAQATQTVAAGTSRVGGSGVNGAAHPTEQVRIASDADLMAFAQRVLTLADDPAQRRRLESGALVFTLSAEQGGTASTGVGVRLDRLVIERGAVTERHVKAAAKDGRILIIGRAAVLTPLARDSARRLGVHIEKEN